MLKNKIFSAALTGLILISLAGCGVNELTAEKETSIPSQPISADVTSDYDKSDDITAESNASEQTDTSAGSEITAEEKKDESKATASSESSKPQQTGSQATNNTTSKPADTQNAAESSKSKETEKPAESSKPQETSKPAEPVKEKSIYDYEFNIKEIEKELIKIGEDMGLTHITKNENGLITPDNCSWAIPVTASKDYQGTALEKRLKDYVKSMPSLSEAYGGGKLEYFTIYTESLGGGSYKIYFLG